MEAAAKIVMILIGIWLVSSIVGMIISFFIVGKIIRDAKK